MLGLSRSRAEVPKHINKCGVFGIIRIILFFGRPFRGGVGVQRTVTDRRLPSGPWFQVSHTVLPSYYESSYKDGV